MTAKQKIFMRSGVLFFAAIAIGNCATAGELKDFKPALIEYIPDDESEKGATISVACARAVSLASESLAEKFGDYGTHYEIAQCRRTSDRIEITLAKRESELRSIWTAFADRDGRVLLKIFMQR